MASPVVLQWSGASLSRNRVSSRREVYWMKPQDTVICGKNPFQSCPSSVTAHLLYLLSSAIKHLNGRFRVHSAAPWSCKADTMFYRLHSHFSVMLCMLLMSREGISEAANITHRSSKPGIYVPIYKKHLWHHSWPQPMEREPVNTWSADKRQLIVMTKKKGN